MSDSFDYSGGYDGGFGMLSGVTPEQQVDVLHKVISKLGDTWIGRLATSTLAPGRAAMGQYETTPATPGILTDEDVARSQLNNRAMYDQAGDLGNLAVSGGIPKVALEGVGGMSKSTFGSIAGAGKQADLFGHNGGPSMEPTPGTNPGGFYSAAGKAIQNSPFKTPQTVEQWAAWLRNQPGVKPEELASLGLDPDAGVNPGLRGVKLDKDQLALGHVEPNTPKFNETILGDKLPWDEKALAAAYPQHVQALREYGLEPTVSPDGTMLGFIDGADGDIIHPSDLSGPGYDVPPHVANAAEDLNREFMNFPRPGGRPARFSDYSGIRGQGDGVDPNYRERVYQLDRPDRDGITPDDIATQKYGKSWEDLTKAFRTADDNAQTLKQRMFANTDESGTAELSRQFLAEQKRANTIQAQLDILHNRMVDDTLQRKPYWINRGQAHGSDEIMKRAVDNADSAEAYGRDVGDGPDAQLQYYDEARRQMRPHTDHSGDTHDFTASHWQEEPNALYHLRTTDGDIVGNGYKVQNLRSGNWGPMHQTRAEAEAYVAGMPESAGPLAIREAPNALLGGTHHLEEVQSDWMQKLRDRGYQLPPQAEPTIEEALKGTGYKITENPNKPTITPEQMHALNKKIVDYGFGTESGRIPADARHFKDGIADDAVKAGVFTPEEAQQWLTARNAGEPFSVEFGPRGSIGYKTRADAEQSVMDEFKGDKNGIYRLPEGSKTFAPGEKLPDGKAAESHAVKLPQSYRGKNTFYGSTAEEAEGNALEWMRKSYNAQIPDAPFKGNWHELALKQAVLDAVKNGKSAVSWWPGEVHADRYGFERQVSELRYDPHAQELKVLPRTGQRAGSWQTHKIAPDRLPEYVGPEIAEKLTQPLRSRGDDVDSLTREYQQFLRDNDLPQRSVDELVMEMNDHAHMTRHYGEPNDPFVQKFDKLRDFSRRFEAAGDVFRDLPYNSVKGDELKFSDERAKGMRGFYDTMLPRAANSLFKKYGAKVEQDTVTTPRGSANAHILRITPKLRETVQNEGLPLFQAGVPLPSLLNGGRDDQQPAN